MEYFEISRSVFGLPLQARITGLDEGISVLLTGGCRTHVGAVSLAAPEDPVRTLEAPGHRDAVVSEAWAKALCGRLHTPVCVACGIHYSSATGGQIRGVLSACDRLLEDVLGKLLQ